MFYLGVFFKDVCETGMKNSHSKAGFLLLSIGLIFLPLAGIANESDWQVWFDQSLGYDYSSNATLRVDQSFRMQKNISRLETYSIQVGVQMHRRSWIEHGLFFRYLNNRAGDFSWDEFRPTYDLSLKWNWGKTRWTNRSRFEYRIMEQRENIVRYRNQQKIVLPWELIGLKAYSAAEIFSDFSKQDARWVENRLRGMIGIQTESDGFIRKVKLKDGRRVTSDIYLMYQQTEGINLIVDEYILGFKLGYFF